MAAVKENDNEFEFHGHKSMEEEVNRSRVLKEYNQRHEIQGET